MTESRFYTEPDKHGEPTIYAYDSTSWPAIAVLRRCDVPNAAQHHWPEIVARILQPPQGRRAK